MKLDCGHRTIAPTEAIIRAKAGSSRTTGADVEETFLTLDRDGEYTCGGLSRQDQVGVVRSKRLVNSSGAYIAPQTVFRNCDE
jgi:hypothetical protein